MRTSTSKHGHLAAPDYGQHIVPTQSGFKNVNMPTGKQREEIIQKKEEEEADDGVLALDGKMYGKDSLHNTDRKTGLTQEEADKRLAKFGHNELPEKKKNIWLLLFYEFVSPMAIIVWLAIILEVVESSIEISEGKDDQAHGDIIDVVTLLLLQFLNVFVGFFEEMKAENAIEELKKSLLPMAMVKRDGEWKEIEAREVAIGDIVKMPLGGRVAADGENIHARVQIDESQLTGESLPKTVKAGGKVLMGAIVSVGDSEMIAHATGRLTYFGKTADLLQDKAGKGHFEELLQLMLWVLVVLGIVVNVIIIVYLETGDKRAPFLDVLSFAAVLLIASIPIALRVVCVTTLALGARELSDQGAIVAKMNAVEEIATMTLLCSDKTGTLTQNKMIMLEPPSEADKEAAKTDSSVETTQGWRDEGVSFDNLLQHATLAAKWWEPPEDALDTLILNYVAKYKCVQEKLSTFYAHDDNCFQPFDARKKRTQATIKVRKGTTAKTENLPEGAMGKSCDWTTFKLPEADIRDAPGPNGEKRTKKVQLRLPGGSTNATIIDYHTDGRDFKVMKGAPLVLLDKLEDDERKRIEKPFMDSMNELGGKGIRSLAVAISYDGAFDTPEEEAEPGYKPKGWKMLGLIAFKDPVRPDSKATIDICRHLGISVKMVTGDQEKIAKETSRELGLDTNVLAVEKKNGKTTPLPTFADAAELREMAEDMKAKKLGKEYGQMCFEAGGFAQVYPEHKYLIVSALQQLLSEKNEPVGMTGDGVNDAPALHRANIGIAVEGATKAAQGVADIVLTAPGLSAVVSSVVVSRKIFSRMKNFVVYRIACTLQLLFFFLIACLVYKPSDYCAENEPFFFLPVCALVTIVILNDGTIISVAFDNVLSSKAPEEWNMTVLTVVSSVVGGVALISSLLILQWSLECSGNHEINLLQAFRLAHPYSKATHSENANLSCHLDGKFDNFLTQTGMDSAFGLSTLRYDSIKTLIYLKIALSDYLSLFNSRCQGWFFSRVPSWHVMLAAVFSTVCSSLLSHWWPLGSKMKGIGVGVIAFVWLYTIVWGLIQDCFKVLTYYLLNLKKKEKVKKTQEQQDLENKLVGSGKYIDEDKINAKIKEGRELAQAAADAREKENIEVVKELPMETAH